MIQGYTPDGNSFYAGYDAENRLTGIEYTDPQSGQHQRFVFTYDHNDFAARVQTYVNHVKTADLRIVRNGYLPLQDRDSANTVQRAYTWGLNMGGGIGGLLAMTQDKQHYQYLYDGKGNVSAVLDAAARPVASYRYNAFGKLLSKAGSLEQPFGFSTKRYFEDFGLSYYGYRFYQPVVGRWLTRDPLQEAGGVNLYGFVSNNPVNMIDPYGLFGEGWGDGGDTLGHSDFIGSDRFDYNREDRDPLTSPFNTLTGTARHFRDLRNVEYDLINLIIRGRSQNAEAFERLLHQGQDYFSHYGKGYRWPFGHAFDGTIPDQDEGAWQLADEWTARWLAIWDRTFENDCP